MNIIQATKPDWFGNHAWILPASFVVLFVGLIVWLCQYGWAQKILGIPSIPSESSPRSESPPEKVIFSPLQLEALIFAHELRSFLNENPIPKKTDFGWDPKSQSFPMRDQVAIYHNHKRKLDDVWRAKYALNYRERAMTLFHQFAEAGRTDRKLERLADLPRTHEELEELIDTLRKDVFDLEKIAT